MSARPPRLSLNLLASLAGSAWTALLNLALVPVYIRLLGQEGYGLVGFYLSLQATLQLLDLGLSPLLSRDFAGLAPADRAGRAEARDLLRTIEVGYWLLGIGVALALAVTAPWIATHWLNPQALAPGQVAESVRLMGVLFAVQWPLSVYQSSLIGRQHLVSLNVIQVGFSSLAAIGALAALIWIEPSPQVYFVAMILANVLRVGALAVAAWRALPGDAPPRLRVAVVRRRWAFAAAMAGVAATGLALTQLDRLVISWTLPLADLGLYAVAALTTTGLGLIAGALFSAYYPRLTAAVSVTETVHGGAGGSETFHLYAQTVAVLAGVPAGVLLCFSPELFTAWLGDANRAAAAAPAAAWLALGSGLNALMTPLYALQLAHNRADLALRLNVVLVAVAVPALLVLTPALGLVGAAVVWPLTQGLYVLVGAPLTLRRLLPGAGLTWLWRDVARPLGAAWVVLFGLRLVLPVGAGPGGLALIAAVSLLALALGALAAPDVRARLGRIGQNAGRMAG